jgi:CDP-paratose 2-epimerase
VAHFLYSVLAGRSITIYGDGLQVRDILHVQDLVDAMNAVRENVSTTHGQIYNLGGGFERAFSVIEMLRMIEAETGMTSRISFSDVRPGDQPHYVTNTAKLQSHTGWQARRSVRDILRDIQGFWNENPSTLSEAQRRSPAFEEVA